MDGIRYEHCPLLSEEPLVEENYAIRYHRKSSSMTHRSRSRNNIRGAASILTRWPDHWSSFLTYWWIGLGMISLTTLVIYNSLFFFTIFPSANTIPARMTTSTSSNQPHKLPALDHVYMHVVANYNTSVDLLEYLPLVREITRNYTRFCYHFIIVQNDTLNRNEELSAEHNNENALNFVLNDDITYTKQITNIDNIIVEQISLTKFMDDSPAKKYWRLLSNQFVEFLIRAASVWEKGGITFNPFILKSQWSVLYIEKLKDVLETFENTKRKGHIYHKKKHSEQIHADKMKVNTRMNNIRDIIDAMENENNLNYSSNELLIQTENRNTESMLPIKRKLFSIIERTLENNSFSILQERTYPVKKHKGSNNKNGFATNTPKKPSNLNNILKMDSNKSSSNALLPSFLNFLFHHQGTDKISATNSEEPPLQSFTDENSIVNNLENSNTLYLKPNVDNALETKTFHPIVVPLKQLDLKIEHPKKINELSTENSDESRITIDIKGNIIATESKCHAFLGTLFNYAAHEEREVKVTDFILSQLSIFCKGVLSSCNGIDLILL